MLGPYTKYYLITATINLVFYVVDTNISVDDGNRWVKTGEAHGLVDNISACDHLEDAIMYVKNHLTKEWRDVGRFLGLSHADLEHINEEYSNNPKERNYHMLQKWREQYGKEANLITLEDALRRAGRQDLADNLAKDSDGKYVCRSSSTSQTCSRPDQSELQPSEIQNSAQMPAAEAAVKKVDGTLTLLDQAGRIVGSFQDLSSGRGRHNLVMGKPKEGDQLLFEEKIHKEHDLIPLTYQHHTFRYNRKGRETITSVVVKDGWDDDTGGYPERKEGGPGENYVEVNVKSKLGRGMDFTLYVYGRK